MPAIGPSWVDGAWVFSSWTAASWGATGGTDAIPAVDEISTTPVLDTPALTVVHDLTPDEISTTPVLDTPTLSGYATLVESQDEGQYLIEVSAYIGGGGSSGGLWTLTEGPLAAIPTAASSDTGEITLLYADKHWVGSPSDADQPNMFYEGRGVIPLIMERTMPSISPSPFANSMAPN